MKKTHLDHTMNESVPKYYRYLGVDKFPMGDGKVWTYSRQTHSGQILTTDLANLLDRCQTFRTLDDHAQQCYHAFQNNTSQLRLLRKVARLFFAHKTLDRLYIKSIKESLLKLAKAGYLIPQSDLLACSKRPDSAPQNIEPISSVGFITRDRIDSLKCSLNSFVKNSVRYGRKNEFVVMDGSENVEIRDKHRELLHSVKKRHNIEVLYAGMEEKLEFSKALCRKGFPPDIINFALFDTEMCGHSTGTNRNALLLDTIGQTVFSVDDDTVCQIAPSPDTQNSLAFTSRTDPTVMRFFPDRKTALQSVCFKERDILALHEKWLGHHLNDCISTDSKNTEIDFNRMRYDLYRRLHNNGKILATFNGLIGDCGLGSLKYYLFLSGKSFQNMTQSKSIYHFACEREVLRTVNCPTISDASFCMSYSVGLDNRKILPPFMPVNRAQDTLFGLVLWKCFAKDYICHLPWMIYHAPHEARSFTPDSIWKSASGLRINEIIGILIESCVLDPGNLNEEERLCAIGRYLEELGKTPLRDFEDFARMLVWQQESAKVSYLENQLKVHKEQPDFWAKDVKKYMETLRNSLPKMAIPYDLSNGRGEFETLNLMQCLVLKFGQLLHWWPELVKAANELRIQGQRLSKPV